MSSLPPPPEPQPRARESSGTGQALFVLGLSFGLLAALVVERVTRSFLDRDMELVRAVRDMTMEDYVGDVDSQELLDDALRGMVGGLDRYSHYYGPPELSDLDRETSGEFRGIGVVFRRGEVGRILFPYPGSPADKAGLAVGDKIVSAEGKPVDVIETPELQSMLHREEGKVHLGVESLDGARRDVLLQPGVVLDPTVRHTRLLDAEHGIGYLSIRSFSHRTPEEFDQAIADLRGRGLAALVLDLRANPGGILDAAVTLANRFIPSGSLVATRTRSETQSSAADPAQATLAGMPTVVLLDGGSASASEVLAAALQDRAVAVLVGTPSYGKSTVQTLKRIGRDRAVVKITTARYLSPSMRRIEHEEDAAQSGIAPDLWVPLTPAEEEAVHRFLASYSPPDTALPALHRWEENEKHSLIDSPPEDRQLDAAVSLLAGQEIELRADPHP